MFFTRNEAVLVTRFVFAKNKKIYIIFLFSEVITCVLHLDHMRNKTQYTKTIKRWCDELGIYGRLVFYHRWIFIILQSNENNIKVGVQHEASQYF